MLQLSADSEEYIKVRVSANEQSTHNIDPTSYTVDMAIVDGTPEDVEWEDAEWETDTSTNPDRYYIRCLASAFNVEADNIYGVWVRIFSVPETVIRKAGLVSFY